MRLLLQRDPYEPEATMGALSIDGAPFCVTLEPPLTAPEHPCIPAGTYPVIIAWSPHFDRPMPHLEDVPGRTEIEIHWGNYPSDTEGCILVGESRGGAGAPEVLMSREAFDRLYPQLASAQGEGITIEIREGGRLTSSRPEGPRPQIAA